jgi:peptidoglycan hydrolase CwlO-like protein
MKMDKMAIYLIGNPKEQKEYEDYLKSKLKELDNEIKRLKEQILNQNK